MKTLRLCLVAVTLLLFIFVPSYNAQAAGMSIVVTSTFLSSCDGSTAFNYVSSNVPGLAPFDVQFNPPGTAPYTESPYGVVNNGSSFAFVTPINPVPPQPHNWSMTLKLIFRETFGGPIFNTTTLVLSCNVSTNVATVIILGGGGSAGPAHFTDGRLNDMDYGQSAAVYCENGGITVYGYSGKWGSYLAFKVSKAQLAKYPEKPAQNTLIIEKFGIRLYKLTSGEYQVNAATDEAGKEYSFRWPGCPTS